LDRTAFEPSGDARRDLNAVRLGVKLQTKSIDD